MAKTVFVHGMRMQDREPLALRASWYKSLRRGLLGTTWGRANPHALPALQDVELAFWGDLFAGPDRGGSR